MPHGRLFQLAISPIQRHTIAEQTTTEIGPKRRILMNIRRRAAVMQAKSCKRSCRLADIPLDWMQSEAAVGDVGCANVLGGGYEVPDANGDQGAERDLKWAGAAADAYVFRSSTMNVDRVPSDANRVLVVGGLRPLLEVD
jgi:hypothetical protein